VKEPLLVPHFDLPGTEHLFAIRFNESTHNLDRPLLVYVGRPALLDLVVPKL
jgi:hypothetical protein